MKKPSLPKLTISKSTSIGMIYQLAWSMLLKSNGTEKAKEMRLAYEESVSDQERMAVIKKYITIEKI